MPSNGMAPTILKDEQLLVTKKPDERYSVDDVILYEQQTNDLMLVKRIVAMGGDHVEFKDGILFVNDTPSHVQGKGMCNNMSTSNYVWNLQDDEFFVIGDNLENSQDSRHTGPIKESEIIGKVFKKV